MYIPKYFEVTNQQEIYAFIEANGFGQLTSNLAGRLFSTHLPFLLSKDRTKLLCHLAKENPQASDIEGQEVLVTLQGPHDYISPSWYLSPGVPTWNYQAAHIYGRCKVFSEIEALKQAVEALTSKYESGLPAPWQPEYSPSMLKAIVGIEIHITEIQCKYKLSQNRTVRDREQVIEQLKNNGSNRLAEVMERNPL
ncbi:FMN-binding negative transcriptional regulator [Exilibacterium tricleocarpae]|uniref:FMN-binding negative transcriptional regulator n=1 Tax=Exilibacterium tricleocarpae TaxID=2591008 RepID=A0A545TNL7_9GAMM|nr:FMN-binding negative transcriptional regulator [Exilibacterium tricleocarpae]TQV78778.1 FMN-binding negative transcriptional regulator [Exilibacterium tricleocarpae]